MSQLPSEQGPVIPVKPQPNVYTVLLIVAILALIVSISIVLYNLMTTYGMTFAQIFQPSSKLITN